MKNVKNPIFFGFPNKVDRNSTDILNYFTQSTIVGWSSFTTSIIYYQKIGSIVYVYVNIVGTSNSTSVSITLPYKSLFPISYFSSLGMNNGAVRAIGKGMLSGITVNYYNTVSGGAWIASGIKEVQGEFFYLIDE
jgi:hypothetical protein